MRFLEIGRDVIQSEFFKFFHGLERLFGLVLISLQDQEQFLIIKDISIVLDFMLDNVLLEFVHFFNFVLIMFDLPIVEEPCTLFTWLCFLFLFYQL